MHRSGRSRLWKITSAYALCAGFCLLFGVVYEQFGHGVHSAFMIGAFLFPLVGGALPFSLLALCGKRAPGRLFLNLYSAGIAALTVGSLLRGALEIYGTESELLSIYWIAGAALILAGTIVELVAKLVAKRRAKRR